MRMGWAAGAVAAVTLAAGGASAATVVYTWTGTVVGAQDGLGIFGKQSVLGQAVTLEFTVDTLKGRRSTGPGSDYITSTNNVSLGELCSAP